MVKIEFDQVLKDLEGKPIKEPVKLDLTGKPEKEESKDLTLKTLCINALLANIPNEQVTGEKKLERWQTAQLIYKGGEVDITAETIALLKRRIGLIYSVRVSGQAWQMLENAK